MRLDYNLTHLIDNYKDNEGCAKYDYVGSTVWFSKQELCDEVGEFLGVEIPLEVSVFVTREQMESVRELLQDRDLIGLYGDDFLNEW